MPDREAATQLPREREQIELLAQFPEGYKHLGYLQSQIGYDVKKNMPGLKGPEVERLYAEGKAWLEGAPTPGDPG